MSPAHIQVFKKCPKNKMTIVFLQFYARQAIICNQQLYISSRKHQKPLIWNNPEMFSGKKLIFSFHQKACFEKTVMPGMHHRILLMPWSGFDIWFQTCKDIVLNCSSVSGLHCGEQTVWYNNCKNIKKV